MATITHPSRLDTRKAAKAIRDWLDQKGFETKALEAQGAYTIKARKGSAVRAVLGADRALEVEVRHAGNQTIADVRQGSWKTNIVSNAVWLVATGGMNLAVSGWSVIIQKDLESYIRSLFAELGGVHVVDLADGAAVRQGQLACNLSDVPAENTNLFPCPDCGNSVSRFATACPQCGRPVALTPEQRTEQQERERQLAAEKERLAREEQERQRERAERLAAQRQRQNEEELERQREAQQLWEEEKRQWKERMSKALCWGEERSRAALVAVISGAIWLLRRADRVFRGLTRHRRNVRVRRVLVLVRWWGRKADRALRGWSSRLGTLNEAGMRRCLWLVSAIVLILVLVVGALAVNGGGGKQAEPIRGAEKQDGEIQSTAAAPGGSHKKALTKAQEEQIRLRLQALYGALYSLPASVPLDQGPAVMQQEANLRAQISDLEAQLADPSHPTAPSKPEAADGSHPSPAPTASESTDVIHSLPTGWVKIVNRKTGGVLHGDRDPLRIEPAGDYFRLRCKQSDQFLAIRAWAKNQDDAADTKGRPLRLFRQITASDDPSSLWEIKPIGDRFYTITNHASGKCLESRTERPVVRQSMFRSGALEQQWRLEPVESGEKELLGQRRSHASKAIFAIYVYHEFHLPPDVDLDKCIAYVAAAIPHYTDGIRLHPQDATPYQQRGLARCIAGQWEPGIADLTEAIRLAPKDVVGYELRAFVRCAIGEWEPAIADLSEAIRLHPTGGKYYALRSVAYAKNGNLEAASADREHAKASMYPMDEVTGLAELFSATDDTVVAQAEMSGEAEGADDGAPNERIFFFEEFPTPYFTERLAEQLAYLRHRGITDEKPFIIYPGGERTDDPHVKLPRIGTSKRPTRSNTNTVSQAGKGG